MRGTADLWIRIAGAGLIAVAASLALARVHPFGDAGLYGAESAGPLVSARASFPPEVRAILAAKCAACHSMGRPVPFYGRFAPASWLMERDVIKGRTAMNLDRWDEYSPTLKQSFAAKIEREGTAQTMPPLQYLAIHWDARLTEAEVRTLADWAHESARNETSLPDQLAFGGDPVRGKDLFERRCTGCHSLTANREGPMLRGVYGRVSGTAPGFAYSGALKKAHVVWDETLLERWLTDPDLLIPGNDMDFLVNNAQDRRDLIEFLKQLSGK